MAKIWTYTVVPKLPKKLAGLATLANNLWWAWDPEGVELFFRIDRELWIECGQNPKLVLGRVSQDRLEKLMHDDSFLAHLDRAMERFESYVGDIRPHLGKNAGKLPEGFQIAYFSAEFGLHESLSIYSGGLGLLAGDYMKSASDMAVPMVGVGLLYREGYFRQYLNADGWQQELYPQNDFYHMPLEIVRDRAGAPLVIEVDYPDRPVKARIWKCPVGRVALYLLDCDFEENDEADREITGQLYGGDRDMRIRQEIMLGMGGVRALRAMGIQPTTYHMNEGHSSFMTLERIRDLMRREPLNFEQAADAVRSGSMFTTHTPVPAGNDTFEPILVQRYFARYCQDVGITMDRLLAMGRQNPKDTHEPFNMTVLALRFSAASNGVSELHGEVARDMWTRTWPGVPKNEIPITSITNGVHCPSWVSRDLSQLYDRYLGPDWVLNPQEADTWNRINDVPDTELWRTHERRRERLVNFARHRLEAQLRHRGAPHAEIAAAREALDPEALTLGFARRFATYKRSNLILLDPERLAELLNRPGQPVQIIFAGKAHPADSQGKELIRNIIHLAREPRFRNRIVFIENYDINVARYMVQGVDCWINTPRRPMEASGTSGMKAAANGALNISIPDGWWCEAMGMAENGWTIGMGETYRDTNEQDVVESETLYEILEKEVIPMFYDRSTSGVPRSWVARMKNAIRTICPQFNSNRMLQEYAQRFYLPCSKRRNDMRADNRKRSILLTSWKQRLQACWNKIHFISVESGPTEGLPFGSNLQVMAEVYLDELTDTDVAVEIYYGPMEKGDGIGKGKAVAIPCVKRMDNHVYRFEGAIPCDITGQLAFTVRVLPHHEDLGHPHETGLITWA